MSGTAMEMSFPSLPVLLLAALLFILVPIVQFLTRAPPKNLPPGPRKLPIIGNIHQMLGGPPGRVLQALAQEHGRDLMHLRLGQVDHVVVSSVEAAREILQTHDANFASRPRLMGPDILFYGRLDIGFSPHGSYWRQVRKICTVELLSARRVKSFAPLREQEISTLVRQIRSTVTNGVAASVNVTKMLQEFICNSITRTAIGSECKHAARFISAVKKGITFLDGLNPPDLFPSFKILDVVTGASSCLKKIHKELDELLNEIIEEHVAMKGRAIAEEDEDLLDVLLKIQDKGDLEFPMSMDNIKAVILDMFMAGIATTSTTMVWAMAELMRNPEVMKKLQSELREALKGKEKIEDSDLDKLHYLSLFVKESLRVRPAGPFLMPRVCNEPCKIMGYDIPSGTRVLINVSALARDPKYWEDPESFKPERFEGSKIDFKGRNYEYLPFGAGRRICPGISFGLANVNLVLAQLLFHFDWELPDGMTPRELDMTEQPGLSASKKVDLFLLAKPYCPSNP